MSLCRSFTRRTKPELFCWIPLCLHTLLIMCDRSQPIPALVSSAHLHVKHNQTLSHLTISTKWRMACQGSLEKYTCITLRSTSVCVTGTRSDSFSKSAASQCLTSRDALVVTSHGTNQPSIICILKSRDWLDWQICDGFWSAAFQHSWL